MPKAQLSAIDMGYDMVRYELLAKIGESMARDLQGGHHRATGGRSRLVTTLRSVILGCGSYLARAHRQQR